MPASARPNILVFMADQLPADFVREGHPCRMERVRALALEGLSFTHAFTPSPHCCPSRATFMTGLYPSRHGVWNNVNTNTAHQRGWNPGVRCFAELLRAGGYDCAIAGKWHATDTQTPVECGWREFGSYRKNYLKRDNDDWTALAKKPAPYAPSWPDAKMVRHGWGDEPAYGATLDAATIEETPWYESAVGPGLRALRELAAGARPWCLFVSTDMVYRSAAPRFLKQLYEGSEVPLPASFDDPMLDKPRVYRRMRRQFWDQLSEAQVRESLRHYWACATMQDRYFGLLLDALDAAGQGENTLVLFVADHGDYAFAHGLAHMGIPCFREAYHVPAILRWPRGICEPGREVPAFATLADFAPTFLDVAGVEHGERLTGRSLRPFFQSSAEPAGWPGEVHTQTKGNECYFTQRSVTTGRWKYVCNWFDYDELYDLRNDPHERVNLAFPSEEHNVSAHVARGPAAQPWPPLAPELDAVRRDLLGRMWRFAIEQDDVIFNAYLPVALPPYGPLEGLRGP